MTRHVGLLAAIATATLLTSTPAPAAGPAAFYEALLTEIDVPAMDGASKAPATVTVGPPKVTPAKK